MLFSTTDKLTQIAKNKNISVNKSILQNNFNFGYERDLKY